MELRQLRAFVTVADVGHFRQAAEQLNLTQPGLTQRIQSLERELGVQLLERNAREVRLTPAGKVLMEHARRLIQLEDDAARELQRHRIGAVGHLRVAYRGAGDAPLAGTVIAEFRRRYPSVEVETSTASSRENVQRLTERAIDAAFALLPVKQPAGIASRQIRREEVVLAMRSDHRLARLQRIPIEALRGEPLVMPPRPLYPDLVNALQRRIESRISAQLNVVSEEAPDLAVETVARSGTAALFVIRSFHIAHPVEGLVLRSLLPAQLVDRCVAYREDDPSPALANLLRVIEEVAPFDASGIPEDGELI